VARAATVLLDLLSHRIAGGVRLDDEGGDPTLRRHVEVRAREHDAEAAHRPLRDEHLGAANHPLVALSARRGLERRAVGTGPRLGERPRGKPLAARRPRQVLLLLFLRADGKDVTGAETVVARDRERERSVYAGDLFHAERIGEHVEAGSAVFLGNANPEKAELGEARHDFVRKTLLTIPLARARRDFTRSELTNRVSEEAVRLG